MRFFIASIIILSQVFQIACSYARDEIRKTGTFTNLSYHVEAGDLLGYEIRIVYTRSGYEGTFQSAEGGPDSLVLLRNISIENGLVKFSIPHGSYFEGDFIGKLSKTGLTGTLTLRNGNKVHLALKRGKSYWD